MFIAKESLGEIRVARADIGEPIHGASAAEQLCLKPLAPRSMVQKSVHEKLHQMNHILFRILTRWPRLFIRALARQQKMVHAANRQIWVAHASRHA